MTYFLKSGNSFRVSSKEAMDLHEQLPPGNYVIKMDMFENLYLESIDAFPEPSKIYGDTIKNAERILNTFQCRPNTTGVMLNGEKGSGKTLLAKMLALKGAELGIPTIVINSPWAGDKFASFMQSIDQPCIVLFDEFEKVYDSQHQEAILTLLDGVFPSKKLFVLTCNDKYRIDSHMRNRPGRIYYMIDFTGLAIDFIIEYCNDQLKNKEHIDKICKMSSLFSQFNFDMLKALVEEMNRYDEPPQEAIKMLNAKPEFERGSSYDVTLELSNTKIKSSDTTWSGNPLQSAISIEYIPKLDTLEDDDEDCDEWLDADFVQTDLQEINPHKNTFVFVNSKGERLTLVKRIEKTFNYYDAF